MMSCGSVISAAMIARILVGRKSETTIPAPTIVRILRSAFRLAVLSQPTKKLLCALKFSALMCLGQGKEVPFAVLSGHRDVLG